MNIHIHINTAVPQYLRGTGFRTPPQTSKSKAVQVPYIKWHDICIKTIFAYRL